MDPNKASFSAGRGVPVPSMRPDPSGWEEAPFGSPPRDAVRSSDHPRVPPRRLVGPGTRVEV